LPLIDDDLLLEALTIPQSNGSFNNQRLETLGDAVLQLSVTVHLYNKYPHKHEGQLTDFRKSAVSNKTLRRLAKVVHLEEFMCGEPVLEKKWKYVDEDLGKNVRRQIPRRSLQDCMEAILAAAFLTGGVAIALVTGHALGVNTGGPAPWSERSYPKPSKPMNQPGPLFRELQNSLGYIFHHPNLPIEAVTHGSFLGEDSPNFSYERLEFLGDGNINLPFSDSSV
jgi:endoribonuclease Dicer